MSKELVVGGNSLSPFLNLDGLTVVHFTASWCGPCRLIAPIFKELSEEVKGVTFIKVDTDDNKELTQEYGIRTIPTVVLLDKDNNVLETLLGAKSKENFLKVINEATEKLKQ